MERDTESLLKAEHKNCITGYTKLRIKRNNSYKKPLKRRGVLEMVDKPDLKSCGHLSVRVQVPPAPLIKDLISFLLAD